jgi:hypothetical protein
MLMTAEAPKTTAIMVASTSMYLDDLREKLSNVAKLKPNNDEKKLFHKHKCQCIKVERK